jgi:hypothetical protein
VAVAVGVVILPLYGLVRLGRWTMDKQQRKEDRAFHPSNSHKTGSLNSSHVRTADRFGLICAASQNANNGSARLLASARQLQRLTGAKTQTYPRLGRMTNATSPDERQRPTNSTYESFASRKTLGNNATGDLDTSSSVLNKNSVKVKAETAVDPSYYSYVDLTERVPSESSGNGKSTAGMFTMDFDSLDRLEQWSLNRTVYGMGSESVSSRKADVFTDQSIGSHSLGRRSKSRTSSPSIKKNFILTSLF